MLSKKLTRSVIILIALISITSCSNNNSTKTVKKKTVIHRVDAKPVQKTTVKKEVYSSLDDQWKKENLAPLVKKEVVVPKTVVKVKQAPKQIIEKRSPKVVKVKPRHIAVKPKYIPKKKKVVQRQAQPKARPQTKYKTPSFKAPVNNIKYASLSGDYATNPQAHAFINKMVSKHGFDRGYMNYLLSNTVATPFLQRMAYKDAFGSKRSSKSKPRAGSWNRYRGNFLTDRTINKGIQFWKNNRVALQRAEQTYGVPQEYILGIIGVETRYGGNVGKNRAIDALAAMGFNNPRRGKYFTSELEAYLLMTRKERLDPLKPMSSFAGALGLSQFMPSNIKRYAVDHDRSGGVNLWTPHDAIGSVANYFKKHGWRTGGTVVVPAVSKSAQYKALKTGFKSSHSLTSLRNRGVSASHLGNISGKASLIKLNTYSGDELWLGGHNFYVITRYNHSTHYAMAVHQLAQEIKKRIGGSSIIRQASNDHTHTIESILRGY